MELLGLILIIVLVLAVAGSVPAYPYSREWGYAPSGGIGVILLILVLLMLFGVLPVPGCQARIDAPSDGTRIQIDD